MISPKRIALLLPHVTPRRLRGDRFEEIPADLVDDIIRVDGATCNGTAACPVGRPLGLHILLIWLACSSYRWKRHPVLGRIRLERNNLSRVRK
ncbi:hypothetical protein VSR68_36535 [Paraburkholderia phymatum]